MTISKLLRPDKIAKTKALASSGVRLGMHLVINAALYNALILFCDFGITVIITIITKECRPLFSLSSSEAKRCKNAQYPEVERRLYQQVGLGIRSVTKTEIIEGADIIATEMHISDMDTSNNWVCALK